MKIKSAAPEDRSATNATGAQSAAFMPNTTYAVLGLLSFGQPLCGYELRQWAESSLAHFYWSPAQSQIYKELGRLEARGFILGKEVPQKDRPAKITYAITPEGESELARWLNDAPLPAVVLKHPAALRLYFGHITSGKRLFEVLAEHQKALQAAMGDLEASNVALAQEPDAEYALLVNEWALGILRADLEGAERIAHHLKAQGKN